MSRALGSTLANNFYMSIIFTFGVGKRWAGILIDTFN